MQQWVARDRRLNPTLDSGYPNNDVFDRAAQRIMVEVVGATNMEPQALLRLREAMSRLDGGAQYLATWDTVAVQADLEANTSLPKPRRGSGGPGRL